MRGVSLRGKGLWIGLALVVLIGGVTWGVTIGRSHVDPDPGGRILRAISTIERALPADATVRLDQHHEPAPDTCGSSQRNPFGWNDAQVSYQFATPMSGPDLLRATDISMRAAGWSTTGRGSWTRPIAGGAASATLTRYGSRHGDVWDLNADAPPLCPQLSGR